MVYPGIAISVQQPWAFFLVNGLKPVENRTWPLPEKYIGARVLIHASSRPLFPLVAARETLAELHARYGIPGGWRFPDTGCDVGGIIGMVRLVGCTRDHVSPWAIRGQWHWLTAEAKPLPFMRCKGRLGFFRVDYAPSQVGQGSLVGGEA